MNNNNGKALIKHLDQEIDWILQLNALLAEEKSVLSGRDFTALEALAEKKQVLSEQLEVSAQSRIELVNGASDAETPRLALNEFLTQCSPSEADQINKLTSKLADQLAICRELNIVNGQVIATNIHIRQELAQTLAGNNADAVSVYTATGNVKSSSDTSHHQEA